MKIAISNLAWNTDEDKDVLLVLKKYSIKGIEVAPSKIWPKSDNTTKMETKKYKNFWNKNNIEIVALTSLLYGHPELTIFENIETRRTTFEYLKKQMYLAYLLGAKVMMFGSPKNRIKGALSDSETDRIAVDFFGNIAKEASKYDIYFAIEPNPSIYGGDFILNTQEAIKLTKKINYPNFGINLDASTLSSNKENYSQTIKDALPFTCHAHISEPFLKPIPNGETNHRAFAAALKKNKYKKWLSIEMPLGPDINHIKQIEKTVKFVISTYSP